MALHLAQLNIALPHEPLDSPLPSEFVTALDPVNQAADAAPGFVWRLQTEAGNAAAIKAFGDEHLIVNMSTWESLKALRFCVLNPRQSGRPRRRCEWFTRLGQAHMVLWWIEAGRTPTVARPSGA